jgi:secondary thiamine-phosphate synthase enzyme
MTHQDSFTVKAPEHGHIQNITAQVQKIVSDSGIRTGIVHVFNIGSTAAIGAIEFEPGLVRDLPEVLDRLIPPSREYGHEKAWHDGNGHSHLQATLLGPSLTVPITDGNLRLGEWQQVVHIECDIKSRNRRIVVTVIGDWMENS